MLPYQCDCQAFSGRGLNDVFEGPWLSWSDVGACAEGIGATRPLHSVQLCLPLVPCANNGHSGAMQTSTPSLMLVAPRQANIRMADNESRSPPSPQTKVTIVGRNETYNRENLIGPFLVHNFLGPRPPPPSLF